MIERNDKLWNVYGSFWTDKSLSKNSVRLGVASYHPKCNSDNRIRINTASGDHHFYWYHRTLSNVNNWKLGLLSVVDLTNRVVQKNNVFFGRVFDNNHEAFLRFENDGFRNANPNVSDVRTIWDSVIANYVGRLNRTTRVGV